jgi:hypothetical protein
MMADVIIINENIIALVMLAIAYGELALIWPEAPLTLTIGLATTPKAMRKMMAK